MKHFDKNELKDPIDFIDRMKPMKAKRSKADVWAELEQMMDQPVEAKVRNLNFSNWKVAASVAIVITLSLLATARFYSKSIDCPIGEQKTALLPDGSSVELNAGSSLSYHPFWWGLEKKVQLDGEAFFTGEHAKNFTVVSKNAETTVLGTSFNVLARGDEYEVTCLTGKVKVLSHLNNEEAVLIPNQMVTLNNSGSLTRNLKVDAKLALDWKSNQFIFTRNKLSSVLAEVARRYGVAIENIDSLNQLYTGAFLKQENIEETLAIICKPFDLEYSKLPSGAYRIEPAP